MDHKVVIYLGNPIDDPTKAMRNINTDSPAATNKAVGLARSMRRVGIRCILLSLGRGRQTGGGDRYGVRVSRINGVLILYCAFWNFAVLTHLVSALSLALLTSHLIRRYGTLSVLVYNRAYHYIPALFLARLKQIPIYLDLEDGYQTIGKGALQGIKNKLTRMSFNWLCPDGAMAVNSSLRQQLAHTEPLVCYGVAEGRLMPSQNWQSPRLQILFGGTLLQEVGSAVFLEALEILQDRYPLLADELHFVVTGKGPYADFFRTWSKLSPNWLSFSEGLSREDYVQVLRESHVGLSLRLANFEMGATTFPSKVIEYAEHGLVVLSTRASDVPLLFGDDAIYLEAETATSLTKVLASLPKRRAELINVAARGRATVLNQCSPDVVGRKILRLITKEHSNG